MQRDRPDVDALARAELPVDVVDHLLRLQVGVVVGQRDRHRVPVEHARAERADHEVRPLEVLVRRRRLVQPARLGLEVGDVERVRVDVAVPADDVERVVVEHVVLVAAAHAHLDQVLAALAVGRERRRRAEVALGERRVLEQLAVAVAVAVGGLDLARRVEGQPALRRRRSGTGRWCRAGSRRSRACGRAACRRSSPRRPRPRGRRSPRRPRRRGRSSPPRPRGCRSRSRRRRCTGARAGRARCRPSAPGPSCSSAGARGCRAPTPRARSA